MADAQEAVESSGGNMSHFSVLGSDGRRYTLETLTAGKPVLLVNLTGRDRMFGIEGLNRLSRMAAGKLRVVGVLPTDLEQIRAVKKKYRIDFPLIGNDLPDSADPIVGFMDDENTVRHYLANALLLPNGKVTHVWYGYNRWTLRRMELDVLKYTKVKLSLNLSRFPEKLQVRNAGRMGLPH